jgi:thioredoxin-related protein
MRTMLLGVLVLIPSFAVQDDPDDRFASEPRRPKAEAPVQFVKSWDQARAESKRTGRRILLVFTGDYCGWCRVLEKRTFTDAEVVKLSKEFVCVELKTRAEDNARLVDKLGIDTIPRSFVLTPDGQVVSKRTGYIPAAEYADWLQVARTKSPTTPNTEISAAVAPPPVGASELEADVIIWSVDASGSVKRWGDDDWTGHAQMLHLLRNAGLRPRAEHMARESFPARWDRAAAAGRAPELVMADQMAGLVLDLGRKGRLIPLVSDRLTSTPENASCPDLSGRMAFLVAGSRHEDAGRKAVAELLRSGPEMTLPGPELLDAERRAEAAAVARRAVVAYMSGDSMGLKAVASPSSPQLTCCTKPDEFWQGRAVVADSVEVRGNEAVAFARVDMQWRGKKMVGADSVLVILRREDARWKAFAVSSDILSIKELPALCRLEFRAGTGQGDHSAPRLLYPIGGGRIGVGGTSFAWEVPGEDGALAAQVCQVLLNREKGSSWPETRLKVYPGMPRGRSLLLSETAKDLTGVTAEQMSWCVWSVGRDGGISVSGVGSYQPPEP